MSGQTSVQIKVTVEFDASREGFVIKNTAHKLVDFGERRAFRVKPFKVSEQEGKATLTAVDIQRDFLPPKMDVQKDIWPPHCVKGDCL